MRGRFGFSGVPPFASNTAGTFAVDLVDTRQFTYYDLRDFLAVEVGCAP